MSSVSKAARQLVPAVTRRSSAVASQKFTTSAVTRGGATPPLAPFARIPVESEKLPEQYDAIWDDGVAPEVTLDFDCQHIDSGTGFLMWLGGLGFFATVYQGIKATDPSSKNPAVFGHVSSFLIVFGGEKFMSTHARSMSTSDASEKLLEKPTAAIRSGRSAGLVTLSTKL